jgi:methylamine utilization protein MauJ
VFDIGRRGLMKMWAVIGLDTELPWTQEEFKTTFEGHELVLRPQDRDTSPTVAMKYDGQTTKEDALEVLRRFLSALSWVHRSGIREEMSVTGSRPFRIGRSQTPIVVANRFSLDYVPEVGDKNARLALALYREATSLKSTPYQFLSFFKILNVLFSNGRQQKQYINDNIHKVESIPENKKRIEEILNDHGDVGEYLYESGRCAIAHAYQEPLIDPDSVDDTSRLSKDLYLVWSFAELVIEESFGVKSLSVYHSEHLYCLEGFKRLLDESVVQRLINREAVEEDQIILPDQVALRLQGHDRLVSLEQLKVKFEIVENGVICLVGFTKSERMAVRIFLVFPNEKIEFDPEIMFLVNDDGSADFMREYEDALRFSKALYLNGKLELWSLDDGKLLGRCDPYIPVNIAPRETQENYKKLIKKCQEEAEKRGKGTVKP